jgi:RimJ/RimL family protein N-acetyltransferase
MGAAMVARDIAPRIETPRLILRAHEPADLKASMRLWTDPDVVRFMTRRVLNEEEVWLRCLRHWGSWAMLGYGFWLIEERGTGEAIGETGFQDLKRMSEPSYAGEPEVGWALRPAWQGRGLAREAVDAALAWWDARFPGARLACIIAPENGASMRIAGRAGFVRRTDITMASGAVMTLFDREAQHVAGR